MSSQQMDMGSKIKRLNQLLKSQEVYNYLIKLSGVPALNRHPFSHRERVEFDKKRAAQKGIQISLVIMKEKTELLSLLKGNKILQIGLGNKMAADYGVNVNAKIMSENVENAVLSVPYCIKRNNLYKNEAAYLHQKDELMRQKN